MKKIYTIAAGLLLSASFVSCELKDEILGKGEVPVETGWVELGVQVDNRTNVSITRAAADDAGEGQDTQVDPYNFPISFTHQSAEYEKAFDTYEEMRKTESIELPIGTYTVTAHTPGEMKKEMGIQEMFETSREVIALMTDFLCRRIHYLSQVPFSIAFFSFSQRAFISLNLARRSASSFWISSRCSWEI